MVQQVLQEETLVLHPTVHTLVVNAFVDTPCRQQCFLLLHALENEQTGQCTIMHGHHDTCLARSNAPGACISDEVQH